MNQPSKNLTLNVVPISLSQDKIEIGRIPYAGEEAYRQLREANWRTHAFRYDSRSEEILNIVLDPAISPIGKLEEVEVKEHLFLVARAIQHSILVWIARRNPLLKAGKQLLFWGQIDQSLLLKQAVERARLEPVAGIEVPVRYEIDCRMFHDASENNYLALVIDVSTSNIIDIPVSNLIQKGFDVVGKYVCRRQEPEQPYLRPRLDLIGKVSFVSNGLLLLTDMDAEDCIDVNDALLEPRLENLDEVIRLFYGAKAGPILQHLSNLRHPLTTSNGKLSQIRSTLSGLQKHSILIGNGVEVTIGEVMQENEPLFPGRITTNRPFMLVGPQGRNTTQYPDQGIRDFGPYMFMQHARNTPLFAVVCESQYRGRMEQLMQALIEGFPDNAWARHDIPNPYQGGLLGKFHLQRVRLEYEECSDSSPSAYRAAAARLLMRLPDLPDLAIVQIKEGFKNFRGDNNPYFVSKSEFMRAGVPTQSLCIEKIDPFEPNVAYLINNMALACYAKLDGKPWVISTSNPTSHELIVGLGSSEVSKGRLGPKVRYVGVTTVFQGDGRYLVWGLTREAEFEHYAEALLESLRTTIRFVRVQNAWQSGDSVRLIFHVYKRIRDCEAESIKALVKELVQEEFRVEFAFLDISWSHPYHIFDPGQDGKSYWSLGRKRVKGKGVPPRGLCLQLDKMRGLLHLTGPSDVKTDEQGLPKPLLVELHSDSDFTDLTYLLRQVYHFSYMSWQSFFPGTEPVTIKYSQLIARLLGNLNRVSGWDSTNLKVGSLRERRWFL